MGAGYHGGFGNTLGKKSGLRSTQKKHMSTIVQNSQNMADRYPLNNWGYFGEKGKHVRVIKSPNQFETANDFYKRISLGGVEQTLPNNKGVKTVLDDGATIVYRIVTSTVGSPAVEITMSNSLVKNQKIHFIKEVK